MGTTLQNGVYLPNEGERNCYAGLKTNWEILDQKVADVTALQQAVAGALHREIVESLPTTDIDPNTIYMILSGTSATENVYNEFMYVNNAWELIGTSATDLTNYYTKGDVDGLLLLKANASDLTSHTGDTTIHVTANDKTKWTNSANTHVLRLALSALTPSTSDNSFSNLDDSTALKVGDKVMDTAGVLFEVTAIDTANSTFTIGTALIDLAQDSDVVHKSGDETVGGKKTFSENITCFSNYDAKSIICKTPLSTYDSTNTVGDNTKIRFLDKNNNSISYIMQRKLTNGNTDLSLNISNTDSNNQPIEATLTFVLDSANDPRLSPGIDNTISIGRPTFRYKSFYGMNYYYGSNNVEFSTKFVTTDTNQTISGNKTFSEDIVINNSDTSQTTKRLVITSSKVNLGDNNSDSWGISFNAGSSYVATINSEKSINSVQGLNFTVRTKDGNNNLISTSYRLRIYTDGSAYLIPSATDSISLGSSANKWKDCQTNLINGIEPSSLSLPSDRSARIDISSYITNLGNGDNNTYTVPANGYIWLHFTSINGALCFSQTSGGLTNYAQTFNRYQGDGLLYAFFPVRKDDKFVVQIYTSSTAVVQNAYFIPCQGNV